MDGSKPAADTTELRLRAQSGRRAPRLGGSRAVRSCGPVGVADPGGSNSEVGWESRPPEGQGFPGNASSAGG